MKKKLINMSLALLVLTGIGTAVLSSTTSNIVVASANSLWWPFDLSTGKK